jgi:hypothetical protein
MVQRNELEKNVRDMIAYDILQAPLSSFYQKAKRRKNDLSEVIVAQIEDGETGERIIARLETREQEKARTMKEGIEAFKNKHPRYGNLLEGLIAEKRLQKNRILVYGVQEKFKLGDADYVRVLQDLDLDKRTASMLYPRLKKLSDTLGKAKEASYREMLVK